MNERYFHYFSSVQSVKCLLNVLLSVLNGHLVEAEVSKLPVVSLFEHSGSQFASPLLNSIRERLSGEQVSAFKGCHVLDYLLTVFEAEKLHDCRPLFVAVCNRFADPMGSLGFYFRVVEMRLVFLCVSYFCLCCFPALVRGFLDTVKSDAISARVVV